MSSGSRIVNTVRPGSLSHSIDPLCCATNVFIAGPTPVRVACRPDRMHLAAYANEVATYALDWFGEYYAIPYPERKLDQAAIPDFAQGAMENTGLVTYRETLLLRFVAGLTGPEASFMMEKIRDLHRAGVAIVVVEHVMEVIRRLADHVLVLAEGRIIAEGTFEQVAADPVVIEAYLGTRSRNRVA